MFKAYKKITPKVLKKYKSLGLLDLSNSDLMAKKMLDMMCNEEILRGLLNVTFSEDFSKVDMEEIDLALLMEGIQGFLSQLHTNLRK